MLAVVFFPYFERTGKISSSGIILQIVIRFFQVSVFGISSSVISSMNLLVSSVVVLGTILPAFRTLSMSMREYTVGYMLVKSM
jgi:hypothetical protein